MINRLLPWTLLLPVVLPLLLALLLVIVRGTRAIGSFTLLALVGGVFPLLPAVGLPRQTPALPWLTVGTTVVPFQLGLGSPTGGPSLAPLLFFACGMLGVWSLPRFSAAEATGTRLRVAAIGLLLIVAGVQLALLAGAPALIVIGLVIAALGTLIIDVGASTIDENSLRGVTPLVLALLLITAALADPSLRGTAGFWTIGCLLLVLLVPLRLAVTSTPLLFAGPALAVGLAPLALWLLLTRTPLDVAALSGRRDVIYNVSTSGLNVSTSGLNVSTFSIYNVSTVAAAVLFGLGAINAATAKTLRGLLVAQWIAQSGFVWLFVGLRGRTDAPVFDDLFLALLNAVVSTLVLGLALSKLGSAARSDHIAELAPLPTPLPRTGLAYALAAASAAGLPLTLGYSARQAMITAGAPRYLEPLLMGGSSLLLAGLVMPLAAFLRRPARPAAEELDTRDRAGASLLLALVLVAASVYRASGWLMIALQSLAALGILLYGHRALKRPFAAPIFADDALGDEQPGWALPFAALARILTPLRAEPWVAGFRGVTRWLAGLLEALQTPVRPVENQYYLPLVVLAAVCLVALAVGGAAR